MLKTDLPDDFVLNLTASSGRLPWFPTGPQTPAAIRSALERAERESPYEIHPQALEALAAARTGALTVGQLRVVAIEMDRAARSGAQTRALDMPRVSVTERKTVKRNCCLSSDPRGAHQPDSSLSRGADRCPAGPRELCAPAHVTSGGGPLPSPVVWGGACSG